MTVQKIYEMNDEVFFTILFYMDDIYIFFFVIFFYPMILFQFQTVTLIIIIFTENVVRKFIKYSFFSSYEITLN